jgi:alpha-tubulin suppressor-like RCC1 family protein
MLSRKSLLIITPFLLFLSNDSNAIICARLKSVSAGETHTLALADNNTLFACGSNDYYQLGFGSDTSPVYSLKPVKGENGIGYLKNIVTYDAGWKHSLAVDINETIWSWGWDDFGQLGNGPEQQNWDVPREVNGVGGIGNLNHIVYVSAGRSGTHSLAVDSYGYVYAWGNNDNGQCGDGNTGGQNDYPVLVLDDNPQTTGKYLGDVAHIIKVDAGKYHSLALDVSGHVWHWGENSQSGNYPEKVKASVDFGGQILSNIIQIATCGHSIAVDNNGNVWEWTDSNSAYKVPGGDMGTDYLEDICEVSAGNGHSMARTSEGYVLVWNISYEYPEYEYPEYVSESGLLEGIISIAAGYDDFKLAVDQNGEGWAWGTSNGGGQLGVGDTDSHSYPTQMSCAEIPNSIYLTKTHTIQGSNPNCARPFDVNNSNYLVYTVCYGNPVTNPFDPNYSGTLNDVNIIDHLPTEVNFYSADGNGIYDVNTRTIRGTISNLTPGSSGCFTLTTKVNNYARPGGEISNFVEMTGERYYSSTTDIVPVCNWDGKIIYVDRDANGYKNGTNWNDAYKDLQEALSAARDLNTAITAIWVAAGEYKPVNDTNASYQDKSFELPDNVALIGHFRGIGTYETNPDQRNFNDANNETILEGQIGQYSNEVVNRIVTGQNVESVLLDGFTIEGGYTGIYLNHVREVSIVNCKIWDNQHYGIYAENYSYSDIYNCLFANDSLFSVYSDTSEPDISYCIFDGNDNTDYGLNLKNGSTSNITNSDFKNHKYSAILGNSATINTEGCYFSQNKSHGVECQGSYLNILKSVFENNARNGITLSNYSDLDIENSVIRNSGYQGISLSQNRSTKTINNWIHNNGTAGDSSFGSGIYFGNQIGIPIVWNNTIYDNFTYGIECSQDGADPNICNCIIYGNDTNDLYRPGGSFDKVNYCLLQHSYTDNNSNKTGDPCFINILLNSDDLHIDINSICKDAGDPNVSYDDETDIDGEPRVAFGQADIGGDEYYWSKADYNKDANVNFIDFAQFGSNWREPNYVIDLDNDGYVYIFDLMLFCDDWLWKPAWIQGQWMLDMAGEGGAGMAMASTNSDETDVAQAQTSDALMLPDTRASLAARPARLRARTDKFYDIRPQITVSEIQPAKTMILVDQMSTTTIAEESITNDDTTITEPTTIEEIVDWLDAIWQSGELTISEDEYLQFRSNVQESEE